MATREKKSTPYPSPTHIHTLIAATIISNKNNSVNNSTYIKHHPTTKINGPKKANYLFYMSEQLHHALMKNENRNIAAFKIQVTTKS